MRSGRSRKVVGYRRDGSRPVTVDRTAPPVAGRCQVSNQTPSGPIFSDGEGYSTFDSATCPHPATTELDDGTPACDGHAVRAALEDDGDGDHELADRWVDPGDL